MTATRTCPKCGAELPANAPAGICPICLLQAGMGASATDAAIDLDALNVPTDPVALADAVTLPPMDAESARTATKAPIGTKAHCFGDYELLEEIGRGGMGVVYAAEHTPSGRRVALKVLGHELESPEHRQRFLREGRLAASVNHPNNIYIFGTEEIDGTPVIAMELARGGTLQDCVKRDGPLPVGHAVDVILDVVAGLAAAQAAGVLHRDVKPSNCFVDSDGTVKVGDFGLSISTGPRADTNLTESGVFLGTPAFSSPEQLCGDELDVRSDIYSVGVTLYYLLTGQTPFQAKQMVQLLATVLDRPAPSPESLRSEIPSGLAKVVLRCLAKQKGHRFKHYDELRQALLPYSSAAPTPGTLGFRFLACGLDMVVLGSLAALLPLLWVRDLRTWRLHFEALADLGPQANSVLMLVAGLGMLLHLAYFSILEGIWGAGFGKAICRLRVVRSNREAPGLPRALLRSTIFCASGWLPWWALYAYNSEAGVAAFADGDLRLAGISLTATLLLFCTARRRNGYAGLHDLASGARVVRTHPHENRPTLSYTDDPLPDLQGEPQIGPYHVLGQLECDATHELVLAYDTRLLRKVWVRKCAADTPQIGRELRELARIGRLRWLNGRLHNGGRWDAYEAPPGKPLLSLMSDRQPWDAVRFWLWDLSEELSASLQDQTLPVLELDRVWITADGRAKLLDFPAPGLNAEQRAVGSTAQDAATIAIFLKRVAIASLEGLVLSTEDARSRSLSTPIPVSAWTLLTRLDGSATTTVTPSELKSFTQQPASVSIKKRVGVLAACWLAPIAIAAFLIPSSFAEKRFLQAHPEVGALSGFVGYYQSLAHKSDSEIVNGVPIIELRNAIEIVVVDRFGARIADAEFWSDPAMSGFVDTDGRRLSEEFMRAHPDLSPEQLADAQKRLVTVVEEIRFMEWSMTDFPYVLPLPTTFLVMVTLFMVIFVVLPSLVSVLLFGNSILLRSLDIAIVTKTGTPASRLRVLWRSTVLWSIVLVALGVLIFAATRWGQPWRPRLLFLFVVYWLVQSFTAERGPHDRLAGTWLVPR